MCGLPVFRWHLSLATAIFGGFTPAISTYLIHITGNQAVLPLAERGGGLRTRCNGGNRLARSAGSLWNRRASTY